MHWLDNTLCTIPPTGRSLPFDPHSPTITKVPVPQMQIRRGRPEAATVQRRRLSSSLGTGRQGWGGGNYRFVGGNIYLQLACRLTLLVVVVPRFVDSVVARSGLEHENAVHRGMFGVEKEAEHRLPSWVIELWPNVRTYGSRRGRGKEVMFLDGKRIVMQFTIDGQSI